MERVIYVEVLDRRGQVRQRARIDALPFRIGRGYDNDLILDDLYVSPTHAEISPTRHAAGGCAGGHAEDLAIRDLGSHNGTHSAGGALRDAAEPLRVPGEYRLGRTRLRLRDADHALPDTQLEAPSGPRRVALPVVAALLVVAVIAVTVSDELDTAHGPVDRGELVDAVLTTSMVTAVWVGLWSLITRVLNPHTRFLAHWIVAGSYALFAAGMRGAGTWMRFFVASIAPVQLFEVAVHLVAAVLLFYAHIALTGALRGAQRLLLAGVLSLALVSLTEMDSLLRRPDWVQILPYWSRLLPVDPGWLAREGVDEFFDQTDAVRDSVDALARSAESTRKESP